MVLTGAFPKPTTNQRLRLSTFSHLLKVDDYVALCNSVNLTVLFLPPDAATQLREFEHPCSIHDFLSAEVEEKRMRWEGVLPLLIRAGILVPESFDDLSVVRRIQQTLKTLPIFVLYLLLADDCNFACRYCFFRSGLHSGSGFSLMTPDIAKNAIDRFAQC